MPKDYDYLISDPFPPRQDGPALYCTVGVCLDLTPAERARLVNLPESAYSRLYEQVYALVLAALAEQEHL